jgi:hypothetical protein
MTEIHLEAGLGHTLRHGLIFNEAAMSYMLLIVEPPGLRRTRTEAEGRALYDSMVNFSETLKARGLLTLSQSLKEDTGGARVKVRGGTTSVVDGPFAEAKEMVGGIFLLTCETREQAIAIAAECPVAHSATIEVRELGPCFE